MELASGGDTSVGVQDLKGYNEKKTHRSRAAPIRGRDFLIDRLRGSQMNESEIKFGNKASVKLFRNATERRMGLFRRTICERAGKLKNPEPPAT